MGEFDGPQLEADTPAAGVDDLFADDEFLREWLGREFPDALREDSAGAAAEAARARGVLAAGERDERGVAGDVAYVPGTVPGGEGKRRERG